MNRYDLAKLVQWAGTLRTRKRMQKVVYLLQAAGCALNADFRLHHFGPYSDDVAEAADVMVQLGLLNEKRVGNMAGQQYEYSLTEKAKRDLAELERRPEGRGACAELSKHEAVARQLLDRDVRELEVAATVVHFCRKQRDWSDAIEKTCRFKGLKAEDDLVKRSVHLARELLN